MTSWLKAAGGLGLVGVLWTAAPATAEDALTFAPDARAKSSPELPPVKTSPDAPGKAKSDPDAPRMTMSMFLDRLMLAESGGRDTARNPRSTAVGPFQFIEATFVDVARRHFPEDVEKLDLPQILALRTDRQFARKAAAAFSRDNAAYLAASGIRPTFPNLRLAFLLGPGDAIRVLKAKSATPLMQLLSRRVINANPFMSRLTAGGLVRRAARDIRARPTMTAGIKPGQIPPPLLRRAAQPRIKVRCNLGLASCRRWLALQKRKWRRKQRVSNRHK